MIIVDGRKFRIKRNEQGEVTLVYERKLMNEGHPYLERLVDVPFWTLKVANQRNLGNHIKPRSLIRRILEAAEKSNGEEA